MSFTDHKITSFQHKIADLADQPTLPPDELKSRFDACPEELRQSLNAVCDDAARLEARVEGIVVDTFGDTIDKEMLSDELAAELDGKATQTALSAEAAAREAADTAETAAREAADASLTTAVAQKCEVYVGTYVGNNAETRVITLPKTPKMVYLCRADGYQMTPNASNPVYGGIALTNAPLRYAYGIESIAMAIVENGFSVHYDTYDKLMTNSSDCQYYYFALA